MRSLKVAGIILLLTLAVWPRLAPAAVRTGDDEVLERPLCDVNELDCSVFNESFSDDDVEGVLYLAFMFGGVPGGFASLPNELWQPRRNYMPPRLTMKDLLETIARIEPRYTWAADGGVVNVMPGEPLPLLDARIGEFRAENLNVKEMLAALEKTPDFKAGLAAHHLTEPKPPKDGGFIISGFVGKPVEPWKRFSVSMRGATVREVLNEIVRQDGCAVWSYQEWKPPANVPNPGDERWYRLGLLFYCPGKSGENK